MERLIEAFALLTGRIQKKLDDEFPQLTDALLEVLYPHFLAPVPSMSIVQLELDPANAKPDGVDLERGAKLHTPRIGNTQCRYQTCYPVRLWPLAVTSAELQTLPLGEELTPPPGTAAALRIRLQCQGELRLADLALDTLRFHLSGAEELVAKLYGLIFNNTLRVEFRCLDEGSEHPLVALPPQDCLRHVGFERDEGLLPYSNRSFLGYRLLTEFFFFPYKFHFVDLDFNPQLPADSVLVVKTTCTNRDLPVKLQQAGDAIRFQLETAVPVRHVRCLRAPTSPWRPPLGHRAYWRLISHLTLNHLSLTDPVEGRQALQEMLRLYDFSDQDGDLQHSAVNRRHLDFLTVTDFGGQMKQTAQISLFLQC